MDKRRFTLNDWLSYLETSHAQEIQLGLSRIHEVAERLHLLSLPGLVITVAGTNGKGSTVTALEAIYHAAGYRVACYTSPHLLKFNERIRINQLSIDDEALCDAFYAIEQGRGKTPLTYFEMTTLAAFWYFCQFDLDLVILEVGLGGRLDATNIIDADLSIITTIDFDHQQYLGTTLEQIAYEKAGIIRENKPCIYADHCSPLAITDCANTLSAPLYRLGKQYTYHAVNGNLQVMGVENQDLAITVPIPAINHQAAAAALMASYCLQAVLPITQEQYDTAMNQVTLLARQQRIDVNNVIVVLDVAHNPQAVSWLAEHIKQQYSQRCIHAVFSALNDKDIKGLITPMKQLVNYWYPVQLSGKRAAPLAQLLAVLQDERQSVVTGYDDPSEAYNAAIQQANAGDVVIVFGSFLLVGAVMTVAAAPTIIGTRRNSHEICVR